MAPKWSVFTFIAISVLAIAIFSACIVFVFEKNYPTAGLALSTGILAVTALHLFCLEWKKKVRTWYSITTLRVISWTGMAFFVVGTLSLVYFAVVEAIYRTGGVFFSVVFAVTTLVAGMQLFVYARAFVAEEEEGHVVYTSKGEDDDDEEEEGEEEEMDVEAAHEGIAFIETRVRDTNTTSYPHETKRNAFEIRERQKWETFEDSQSSSSSSSLDSLLEAAEDAINDISVSSSCLEEAEQHFEDLPPENPEPVKIKSPFLGIENQDVPFNLTPLDRRDPEFISVARRVPRCRNFQIVSILKVDNPYLQRSFELRKEERSLTQPMEERLLFHGTRRALSGYICRDNFDWRRIRKDKFGHGVSFSPSFTYASNYSDKFPMGREILVARVMVGKTCPGSPGLSLPAEGCDTAQNEIGTVLVKFEDAEYCPAYIVRYNDLENNFGHVGNPQVPHFWHHDPHAFNAGFQQMLWMSNQHYRRF